MTKTALWNDCILKMLWVRDYKYEKKKVHYFLTRFKDTLTSFIYLFIFLTSFKEGGLWGNDFKIFRGTSVWLNSCLRHCLMHFCDHKQNLIVSLYREIFVCKSFFNLRVLERLKILSSFVFQHEEYWLLCIHLTYLLPFTFYSRLLTQLAGRRPTVSPTLYFP